MRRIPFIGLLAVAAAAGLTFFSCKKVTYDATFTITPTVQRVNNGVEEPRDSVVAYGFDGDTTTWKIKTFEDALNGVFTNDVSGERRSYARRADMDGGTRLTMQIASRFSVVVVCDYADSIYAWRNVQIGGNLPLLTTLVKFRPWKPAAAYPYDEIRWRMVLGRQTPDATSTDPATDATPNPGSDQTTDDTPPAAAPPFRP